MKLFVPGRICLFGEHTDWAGSYRRINGELEKGFCLIAGTNQGLYAEVSPHPSKLIVTTTLNDGTRSGPFEVPMEREALLAEAQKGGFFSYVAGVAYQVLTHYRVRGLVIDNYKTDLPVKKGLSSSAAVSVLVARAFNHTYDLKMTVRGEMEFAYLGEITTPSRCGRMDQGCAYGNRPVMMTFDGDRLDVHEVRIGADFHLVVVDLCHSKDTKEILNHLNHCYPFAENAQQKAVQEYLGPISATITRDAATALESGDSATLGRLMTEAQQKFDAALMPACPTQLTAPVLHKLLSYGPIQHLIHGGKGVGSQGDGTAQLLAKSEAAQKELVTIIERDLKMHALRLTLSSTRKVRKAVIPAAGYGTRLFPATKAIKKELFPVIDNEGRAKPAIMAIVEEAVNAGIEEVGIIVQSGDLATFQDFFNSPPPVEHFNKLSQENQKYCQYLMELGHKITFITQDTQDGFGHAVYCARPFVGNEPFLLMLGDHIYASQSDRSCARQLLDIYEQEGAAVVGLKEMPVEQSRHFGCVTGSWSEPMATLEVTRFVEKPDADYAKTHLHVEGIDTGKVLTVFGQYVLTGRVFEFLEENIRTNFREHGEFQLTPCLDRLRQEDGFFGCLVKGTRFDIGLPEAYRQTVIDFRNT